MRLLVICIKTHLFYQCIDIHLFWGHVRILHSQAIRSSNIFPWLLVCYPRLKEGDKGRPLIALTDTRLGHSWLFQSLGHMKSQMYLPGALEVGSNTHQSKDILLVSKSLHDAITSLEVLPVNTGCRVLVALGFVRC